AEQISAIARQQHPNVHSIAPALQPAEPAANPFEVAVAVYDELLLLPGELAERFLGRNPLALAKFHQSARPPGLRNPGLDGALAEGFARVGDHEIQVDVDHPAETATGFARPYGAVEREEIGRRIAVSNIEMRILQRRQGEMSELQSSLQARQRAYGKPTERYRAPLLAHSLDNRARQSWRREALNDRGVRSWCRRWSATS